MKSKFYFYTGLIFLFLVISWTTPGINIQREKLTDKSKISEIDLRKIPTEIYELKLSDLISDFQVIPIETNPECPIGNTWLGFTKENILIGTQNFPGAAKFYRFDKSGRFLNEIGKSGRGPTEHIGTSVDDFHYNEENGTILIKWNGVREKPQVFKTNGTYLYSIAQPFEFMRDINKWSDSIWFSTGTFAGSALMPKDSFALSFYNNKGKVTDIIPRKSYPPKNVSGYTPSPWAPSLYKYNGIWKLYMEGEDTIFKIIDRKLVPSEIVIKDNKALPYNSIISTDDLIGRYSLRILAETKDNCFIEKSIIKKADVKEFRPGRWGGSFSREEQLVIFDKRSLKIKSCKVRDDIFNFLPEEIFPGALLWQDNNRISIVIQAINLLKLVKDKKDLSILNPKGQKLIEQLKDLKEDSNPVIFSFSLKDRIIVD